MDLSDEDLFPLSDEDETVKASSSRNPVEEHLLKQMHDTTERVEKARSNVDNVRELTERILKKLHTRENCGESSDSDTDSDSYQVTGEPVVKKKRTRQTVPSQILEIENLWQQIIDDKWIVGIVLKNTSNRILENPCLYIMVKDQLEVRGIVSFWKIINSIATRTDQLEPDIDKLVATVALDLPNFASKDVFEAYGTISYVLNEKNLQTPIPIFRLKANDLMDKNFALKFSVNLENAVLAIKSISVDREFIIPLEIEGAGSRLFEFLEENGLRNSEDDSPDVYIAKNNEFFRHCIFEILPCTETEASVRISARTPSHLEVMVRLLRDKFPDTVITDMEDRVMEAAKALERELKLELDPCDPGALHMARIVTNLLIP